MKPIVPVLLAAVLLSTGCFSRRYDVTLRSGNVITSKGKPRLDEHGQYVFKDVEGKEQRVNASRVSQIAPHERHPEKKSYFVK
jgi:hypothetical protein